MHRTEWVTCELCSKSVNVLFGAKVVTIDQDLKESQQQPATDPFFLVPPWPRDTMGIGRVLGPSRKRTTKAHDVPPARLAPAFGSMEVVSRVLDRV